MYEELPPYKELPPHEDLDPYEELARQLSSVNAVKRDLARILPADCPPASAAVLFVLARDGEMRMSRLAELLAVDLSVTSRHVAHVAERGWIDRLPDPADRRSRILRLSGAGTAKLAEMSASTARHLSERLSDWTQDEVRTLTDLLTRLRAGFGDCRASARPQTPVHPQAPAHSRTLAPPPTPRVPPSST
ncbi:MarR family winged helix-turn-helix transcriptional regulator [Streptomyces sp. NA04227]|uniref:MarR family winged helix-turn-helix transcriptional regulator n=1 Tax=Streptomyces sp. NA04227 TaxID=2742136 RepID=UPI0020CA3012|nr:MarR family winged helix-turn-helix transcriptional regulator [Streptomyces sp. NA04227]